MKVLTRAGCQDVPPPAQWPHGKEADHTRRPNRPAGLRPCWPRLRREDGVGAAGHRGAGRAAPRTAGIGPADLVSPGGQAADGRNHGGRGRTAFRRRQDWPMSTINASCGAKSRPSSTGRCSTHSVAPRRRRSARLVSRRLVGRDRRGGPRTGHGWPDIRRELIVGVPAAARTCSSRSTRPCFPAAAARPGRILHARLAGRARAGPSRLPGPTPAAGCWTRPAAPARS